MTRIVFIDTETTSLRPDRRAWDIGLIVREPGKPDQEEQWFIDADQLDLGNADPFALRVGHFYKRHPEYNGTVSSDLVDEDYALRRVEKLTRGAHLVGAVPNFDAEVLATRMRAHGIAPSWHYHLIDVETLAVGYLNASYVPAASPIALPWDSEDLSRRLEVEPPSGEDRHTALGDARWARALYDRVTGRGRPTDG